MTPEWSDFKVLLALARAGSVAGAARELGVGGSTVSRRLSALAESLGACLIAELPAHQLVSMTKGCTRSSRYAVLIELGKEAFDYTFADFAG